MRRIFALTLLLSAFTITNARAELRGKILIKGQNIPVSRALILFSSGAGKGTAQTLSDGSYCVPNLADGAYDVTIVFAGKNYKKGKLNTATNQTLYIP
ncbi:MAG TPA: hypothetical protein VLX28_19945 [Thermoanaerobaculia bacterium]|nr:hypothetical protein [Thermoanaerobaculia bacterium]